MQKLANCRFFNILFNKLFEHYNVLLLLLPHKKKNNRVSDEMMAFPRCKFLWGASVLLLYKRHYLMRTNDTPSVIFMKPKILWYCSRMFDLFLFWDNFYNFFYNNFETSILHDFITSKTNIFTATLTELWLFHSVLLR